MYSKIHWGRRLGPLGLKDFRDHSRLEAASNEEMSTVKDLERAALFYFETALKNVTDANYDSFQDHHKRSYRLMQKQRESAKRGENPILEALWDTSSDSERKEFLEIVRFKNQVFKNENILEGLLFSPDAPLEQAYLHTNLAR